jgi:hypothetical protein
MKLISAVSNDHDNAWGCDYALIDLDTGLARLAHRRVGTFRGQKQADPDLDEVYFWDHHVEYFSPWNADDDDIADSLSTILDRLPAIGDDLIRAPDDFVVPENSVARVECCQMIVREAGFAFIAIPKHASHYVRTAEIPLQLIEAAAAA